MCVPFKKAILKRFESKVAAKIMNAMKTLITTIQKGNKNSLILYYFIMTSVTFFGAAHFFTGFFWFIKQE